MHRFTRTKYNNSELLVKILFLVFVCALLIVPIHEALAAFKVHVKFADATTNHGKYKVSVKLLESGDKKVKKVDIGKEADRQDESELDFYFKFKKAEIGEKFRACVYNSNYQDCERGYNSPGGKTETVRLSVEPVNRNWDAPDK